MHAAAEITALATTRRKEATVRTVDPRGGDGAADELAVHKETTAKLPPFSEDVWCPPLN